MDIQSYGWVVFFDYRKGKTADLVEAGGVYKNLHEALTVKSQKVNETTAFWRKANPSKRQHKL